MAVEREEEIEYFRINKMWFWIMEKRFNSDTIFYI